MGLAPLGHKTAPHPACSAATYIHALHGLVRDVLGLPRPVDLPACLTFSAAGCWFFVCLSVVRSGLVTLFMDKEREHVCWCPPGAAELVPDKRYRLSVRSLVEVGKTTYAKHMQTSA